MAGPIGALWSGRQTYKKQDPGIMPSFSDQWSQCPWIQWSFYQIILEYPDGTAILVHTCNDTHPLHPRVLEDLSSTEAQCCIPNKQLGYEILGPLCDVIPVLVWKLILPLLDALKQVTLWTEYNTSSCETVELSCWSITVPACAFCVDWMLLLQCHEPLEERLNINPGLR